MRSRLLLHAAAAALALGTAAAPAHAQVSATQQLLKRLHEKGILTDEEYAQILAESNAAPAPAAPVASPQAAAQDAAAQGLDMSRMVRMTDKGIGL